ncbi:hypothetical protein BDY19DRAFT_941209 [Irpex rosettiformis]|uniref:Uncharacterized protein n=1 Tax=Irpex rosettiformis TaxID=378272 RepID=A0ACB8U6C4_9APHY|nr:hypothetical protein BDY19DRAFT_941209 [Irpex rosettiformis]
MMAPQTGSLLTFIPFSLSSSLSLLLSSIYSSSLPRTCVSLFNPLQSHSTSVVDRLYPRSHHMFLACYGQCLIGHHLPP